MIEKKFHTVYLRQGKGDDEMYVAIKLSEDLIEMMNKIRKDNCNLWKNRDLDLMFEAEKELGKQILLNDSNRVFGFKEDENNGWIYMVLNGKEEIITGPVDLIKLMWNYGEPKDIFYGNNDNAHIALRVSSILFSKGCKSSRYKEDYYKIPFIQSAVEAIRDYCAYFSSDKCCEFFRWREDEVQSLLAGLEYLILPEDPHNITEDDIIVQEFSFGLKVTDSNKIDYSVGIGNNSFMYTIPRNVDYIQVIANQLEGIILNYPCGGGIILPTGFEPYPSNYKDYRGFPVTIRIENVQLEGSTKSIAKITVNTCPVSYNSFVFGYCDFKQVIKTIYQALLNSNVNPSTIVEDYIG